MFRGNLGFLRGTPAGSSGGRAGLGTDRAALTPVGSTEPEQGLGQPSGEEEKGSAEQSREGEGAA